MIKIDSNFSIYLFFLCLSLIISILFYYLIIPNKDKINNNDHKSYNSRDNNFLKINEIKKIISEI